MKEYFYPDLAVRTNFDQWDSDSRPTLFDRANAHIQALKEDFNAVLTPDQAQVWDELPGHERSLDGKGGASLFYNAVVGGDSNAEVIVETSKSFDGATGVLDAIGGSGVLEKLTTRAVRKLESPAKEE